MTMDTGRGGGDEKRSGTMYHQFLCVRMNTPAFSLYTFYMVSVTGEAASWGRVVGSKIDPCVRVGGLRRIFLSNSKEGVSCGGRGGGGGGGGGGVVAVRCWAGSADSESVLENSSVAY